MLEQAVQSCGCSIHGDVPSQAGWGFGQPDLVYARGVGTR